MRSEYPGLANLVSCFFHEDYSLDYGNADEAVADFLAIQGPETRARAVADVDRALDTLSDDGLRELWADDLRSTYRPEEHGLSYREWFSRMRRLLRDASDS